jgi:Polysaccharide lyase
MRGPRGEAELGYDDRVPLLLRVFGLVVVSLSVGCNALLTDWETGDANGSGNGGAGGGYVRQNLIFEADFEGSAPFDDFSEELGCCSGSVTQSSEQARTGASSFRAVVTEADEQVSGGYRAEVAPNGDFDTGERWYGWSMYFETPEAGGSWLGSYGGTFAQWDPESATGASIVSLSGADGIWDLATNPSGSSSVEYNGPGHAITANTWHDVVFHIDWAGGLLELWLDGEPELTLTGLDFASGPGQFMRFGMSRWGNGPGGAPEDTWVIFYDDLRIGDENATYQDVAP